MNKIIWVVEIRDYLDDLTLPLITFAFDSYDEAKGYVDEYIERLFEEIKKPYRHSQVSEISTYDERKRQFIAVMYDLYNPEIIKYVARATISKVMFYEEV